MMSILVCNFQYLPPYEVVVSKVFYNFSDRKTLLLATGIIVAGGTAAAYMQSRNRCRIQNSLLHCNGTEDNKEEPNNLIGKDNTVTKSRKKRGSLRSLQVLAAILLSRMGRIGAIDILTLVAIAVRFFTK